MITEDDIRSAIESRQRLAAWSRDTGVPKHGDLTQQDRQISRLIDAYYDQMDARQKAERDKSRER